MIAQNKLFELVAAAAAAVIVDGHGWSLADGRFVVKRSESAVARAHQRGTTATSYGAWSEASSRSVSV